MGEVGTVLGEGRGEGFEGIPRPAHVQPELLQMGSMLVCGCDDVLKNRRSVVQVAEIVFGTSEVGKKEGGHDVGSEVSVQEDAEVLELERVGEGTRW